MTNNTLRQSLAKCNKEPGQPINNEEMLVQDVFGCNHDAFYTEVWLTPVKVLCVDAAEKLFMHRWSGRVV